MGLEGIAGKIAKFRHQVSLIKKDYKTSDIINQIMRDDLIAWKDTVEFSRDIRYSSLEDLGKQLFDFLMQEITYLEDKTGSQIVRRPAYLWSSKTGDCKSYSLFVTSVLKNLGINYQYAFASYSDEPIARHVYPIINHNGKTVIVDAVYKIFNKEKPYKHKWLFTKQGKNWHVTYYNNLNGKQMEGLYSIGSVGESINAVDGTPRKITDFVISKPIDQMSEADMDLAIMRQRLEIEKNIVASVRGIGSQKVAEYQETINGVNAIIGMLNNGQDEQLNAYVGSLKSIAKRVVQKTVTVAKKTVKAVANVVTAPLRLAAQMVLEKFLPKAAPSFLYIFATDKATIDKLPADAKRKRDKQVLLAKFIVDVLGMKQNHFMGIVRNGIMAQYKMSPENKIAEIINSSGAIKGIGDIGVIEDTIKAVEEIAKIISKVTGKKAPSISKDDLASEADFKTATPQQKAAITKEVKSKPEAVEPGDSIPSDGGKKAVQGICK
ncbi:MAG: hypothetical protein HXX16_17265 [Bacteroidales bacterium]|nr:hypothetical protein [Bacteroidales bacterium]